MFQVLIVLHVIVCLFLILVVLLQAGKGGGMGIGFGGATSQTVFGSSGAGNFLSKTTAVFATIFILNSLALAYMSTRQEAPRLRELAQQKAASKQAEDKSKKKILDDVEKARQAIEKAVGSTGANVTVTPPAVPPGTTGGDGAGTPPSAAAPTPGAPPSATSPTPAAPPPRAVPPPAAAPPPPVPSPATPAPAAAPPAATPPPAPPIP